MKDRFSAHPVWLSFAPELEAAWQRDQASEHLGQVRDAVGLLAVVFAVFVFNDLVVFRNHLVALFAIRTCVVALLGGAWAWAGTARGKVILTRHLQEYLLGLALVACAGMLGMSAVLAPDAQAEHVWFGSLGYLVAFITVYGFSRLRFAYAVFVGVVTSLAAVVLLGQVHAPGAPSLLVLVPFLLAVNLTGAWTTRTLEQLGRRAFVQRTLLSEARARSEALLRNALPAGLTNALADRLGAGSRGAIAQGYPEVTVVLADLVDFTPLCERLSAEEVAALLDQLFTRFDALCEAHGAEKIKTLGDAWLAASGVPVPRLDHAVAAAKLALDMRAAAAEIGPKLRIGVHTGPAVAGVIGRTRFAYDLWGDAVAGAQGMERGSRPGGIRVSRQVAERLGSRFQVVEEDGGWWLEG